MKYSIFKSTNFPLECHDLIVKCDFCFNSKEKIKAKQTNNDPNFVEEKKKLHDHLRIQAEHRDYEKTQRALARVRNSTITVNSDHMIQKNFLSNYQNIQREISTCVQISRSCLEVIATASTTKQNII